MLAEARASVVASDTDDSKIEFASRQVGMEICPTEKIDTLGADVYAPCALGEVLTDAAIERMRCRIVCGSANNQLADPKIAETLHQRGIIYAPDYVVNAGGLIYNTDDLQNGGFNRERALERISQIFQTAKTVIEESQNVGCSTSQAADSIAEERIGLARDRLGELRWTITGDEACPNIN
jgi:leucine dehydrogenase